MPPFHSACIPPPTPPTPKPQTPPTPTPRTHHPLAGRTLCTPSWSAWGGAAPPRSTRSWRPTARSLRSSASACRCVCAHVCTWVGVEGAGPCRFAGLMERMLGQLCGLRHWALRCCGPAAGAAGMSRQTWRAPGSFPAEQAFHAEILPHSADHHAGRAPCIRTFSLLPCRGAMLRRPRDSWTRSSCSTAWRGAPTSSSSSTQRWVAA